MGGKVRREQVENTKYRTLVEETIGSAVETYRKLPGGDLKEQLRDAVLEYLQVNGYLAYTTPERYMEPVYKMLIRDDCDGKIDAFTIKDCSKSYEKALQFDKNSLLIDPLEATTIYNFEKKFEDKLKKCAEASFNPVLLSSVKNPKVYANKISELALKDSKAWNELMEFPSYAYIKDDILLEMAKQGYSFQLISDMNLNDYRDFVKTNCHEQFMGYRESVNFIKTFINQREFEFYDMLSRNGVNEVYTKALIDSMRKEGIAWDIVARDKNGFVVSGPEFDKHHTIPVYSPNDIETISEVNDFKRLCLINKDFHKYLHMLERKYNQDNTLYFQKIMVPENAACILNFETFIQHDFDNPERKFVQKDLRSINLVYLNKISIITQKAKAAIEKQPVKKNGKRSGGNHRQNNNSRHNGGRG